MNPKQRVWLKEAGLLLVTALLFGCRLYHLERQLSPPYADFLSKVRYIITSAERKIFLELPDPEKDGFIEDFWKRRDSIPESDENEFKTEYFARIKEADRLFIGEGRPGWLTDRGRIYVLFGPPLDRIIDNSARSEAERCREVWYYGDFPVVFRDPNCSGQFQLVTYDLTALRTLNLIYMHELALAQVDAQRASPEQTTLFDFDWRVRKTLVDPERIEGVIVISIPYAGIRMGWIRDSFRTDMEVELELRDAEKRAIWEHRETFEVEPEGDKAEETRRGSFRREIPFVVEVGTDRLRRGKNTLHIRLMNMTSGEELRKEMAVEFSP
ncbi:MAG: GWxTD domain-containing protein [Candidatus Aminicenantes bacterium]|nr:GWxTD domain-containing protein [Candidatus Aminicenantes bacterium]